ncbi:DUF6152 family protein [Nonomuraea zeae]|uniref:Uncharacterized protein n=1 Tax=Nonomuraea zeae TaxID=1642303 RepID=A0A5S4FRD8_9ACTN|nr:DUF6152 family protein [Nonomuraea zeae]TMR23272.1 hypothetical protein ETD85_48195 [Nonomuraea zeae]
MKLMISGLALLTTLHHGWEDFRTERPMYVSGTVSEVRWGNPHPQVRLRVAGPVRVPSGLAARSIPAELEELGGREVLQRSQAFDGRDDEVVLILAPVERLTAWGMPDRVQEGERLEAVGYVHREHAEEFRPELIIRQDGRAIRQRSVPLPQSRPPISPSSAGGPEAAPADPSAAEESAAAGALPWFAGAGLLAGSGAVVAVWVWRKRRGTSDMA